MSHSPLPYPQLSTYPKIRDELVKTFTSAKTRPLDYRKQQLAQLAYLIEENHEAFEQSILTDLGRPILETGLTEFGPLIAQILKAIKDLDKWASPTLVPESEVEPFHQGWDLKTVKHPRGVALIVSPWNYPIILTLGPLCGAIAAGCCAIIKPSEISPSFSNLLFELAPKYLDQSAYRVLPGGVPEITALLDLQWDTIFFTGNERVGKIVATAAAKHVTPCTLELSGKCPAIIDEKLSGDDLKLAAKRIAFGKHENAGQLCVAPDLAVIPDGNHDAFIQAYKQVMSEFYPEGAGKSNSYARIVNEYHFKRINDVLGKTAGEIVLGGTPSAPQASPASKFFMEPTLVINVSRDDALLQGELFAPILPVVKVKDNSEAIAYVNTFPSPLTTYVFTNDSGFKTLVTERTRSGQVVFNDTTIQLDVTELPFGGFGPSGYGSHMGRHSFEAFTHTRGSIDVPTSIEPMMSFRYPPYTQGGEEFVKSMWQMPIPIPKLEPVAVPKEHVHVHMAQKVEDGVDTLKEKVKHAFGF